MCDLEKRGEFELLKLMCFVWEVGLSGVFDDDFHGNKSWEELGFW